MGAIGNCCCSDEECIPCEEQSELENWTIVETLIGFSMSGQFVTPYFGCYWQGCSCEREDNIPVDGEASIVSGWTDYINLLTCGPCVNCNTGLPPAPCPVDINGDINCPPDYPTYTTIDRGGRNGVRLKAWYSKFVDVCVRRAYIGTDKIRFSVYVFYSIAGTQTASYGNQYRWRETVRQCVYNTIVSQTTHNEGSINIPDPIEPCIDLFENTVTPDAGFFRCVDFDPPPEPDPCFEAITTNVVINPCVQFISGECQTVNGSLTFNLFDYLACCGEPETCIASPDVQIRIFEYQSEEFDCDSVPANIEMTLVPPTPNLTMELEWECESEDWSSTIGTVAYDLPTTLTLQVS